VTHPPGTQPQYRRTPLSAAEKARGEANLAPFVAQMLVASGRFRVSADTPDQVELFQGVARRVSDMLQRPVVSYANGRDIVITFGQEEASALALRSPGRAFPARADPPSPRVWPRLKRYISPNRTCRCARPGEYALDALPCTLTAFGASP
jgi:hypothetical protein